MIHCAMFDLGHVLVFFDTKRFYDFVEKHKHSAGNSQKILYSEYLAEYELGRISDDEFFELFQRDFNLDVSFQKFFSEVVSNIKPDKKMVRVKNFLKDNGLKLAIVSNINRRQFEHARQQWPWVFAGFDSLALSFKVGFRKPHPEIWRDAVKNLNVRPEECFFIDDQKVNVAAFEQLGGVGHHYNVVDNKYLYNGRLKRERNKLVMKMYFLDMLTVEQAIKSR